MDARSALRRNVSAVTGPDLDAAAGFAFRRSMPIRATLGFPGIRGGGVRFMFIE